MRGRPLRLDVGLLLAALGGLLLFVLLFSDWYSISATAPVSDDAIGVGAGRSWDAWTSFAWIDLILLLTVAVAIAAAVLAGMRARLPLRPGAILAVLGGISFLLVLYRLISPPWSDAGRDAAPWLALLCLAAVVGGGVLSNRFQEQRRTATRRRPAPSRFTDHNAGGEAG